MKAISLLSLVPLLLFIAACATSTVDPLLIPPEANVDANDAG